MSAVYWRTELIDTLGGILHEPVGIYRIIHKESGAIMAWDVRQGVHKQHRLSEEAARALARRWAVGSYREME